MKAHISCLALLLAALVCTPAAYPAQALAGQSFLGSLAGATGGLLGAATDSGPYADGVRAINESRWSDAIAIFTRLAAQKDEHTPGALFWKAYALNKQGQATQALDACAQLRHDFPASSWLQECGALEIEIRARTGKPVAPQAVRDDDLKLLALNTLMQQDETRAMAEIQEILNGDASERLKEGALFILGQHRPDTAYPQIVRISYAEGDVRVQRGAATEKTAGVWEAAPSGLPLETGFSLATGDGRAEIEFENASTLYLAENSILFFNDIHTTSGIPYTELALLSGTASLHIRPYVAGEIFFLKTPTDNMLTKYPSPANLRVTAYMDGVAITPMDRGVIHLPGSLRQEVGGGHTAYYRDGRAIVMAGPIAAADFSAWDNWVTARYTERTAALGEAMKQAGLAEPLPGLAQMRGQGSFFDCAPYGQCWEPPATIAQFDAAAQTAPARAPAEPSPALITQSGNAPRKPAPAHRAGLAGADAFFPCAPFSSHLQAVSLADATTQSFYPNGGYAYINVPWYWAVCHTGSWIQRQNNNNYVWVPGRKRHHHHPIHWVRNGRTIGFVPIHPHDVKGQLPINREHGIFAVSERRGQGFDRVLVDPGKEIKLLPEPPKDFRMTLPLPLAKAAAPQVQAHEIKDGSGIHTALAREGGIPLTFDHRSQSFMLPQHVAMGGHPGSVLAPLTNRGGDLQAHAVYTRAGGVFVNGGAGSSTPTVSTSSGIVTSAGTTTSTSSAISVSAPAPVSSGASSGAVSAGSHH